jgi:hypothetical protein
MQPRVDRRKFLSMFATGSIGMTVANKIELFNDMKNWVLSPSKTIFIPPALSTDYRWWLQRFSPSYPWPDRIILYPSAHEAMRAFHEATKRDKDMAILHAPYRPT